MLKISTEKLMIVAGIVWLLAGANIANLGVQAYLQDWGWLFVPLIAGSCAVFSAFHIRIFSKMVAKHTRRIYGYPEARKNVLAFFDAKGYIMMAIMMGGGISLRTFGLVPGWFIAFFYTGIGLALMVAGVDFLVRYFRSSHTWSCPFVPQSRRSAN